MGGGQKIGLVLVCITFLNQLCWTGGEEFSEYTAHLELKIPLYRGSTHKRACVDECSYDESNSYYRCGTNTGSDYCSPAPDVTSRNEACRRDHRCDTHGYSYTWCRTESGWDYCGLVHTGAVHKGTRRQKRQPNNGAPFNTRRSNNKEIRFYAEVNERNIADGRQGRNEIEEKLISCWSNDCLGDRARCLCKSRNFRIDQQGQFKRNNKQYYNLQIQKNVPRKPNMSTTVSQVILEDNDDINVEDVQFAFRESMNRRAKITVEVGDIAPTNNRGRR